MFSFEKHFEEMISTMECKDSELFQQMIPTLKNVFEAGWHSRGSFEEVRKITLSHINSIFNKVEDNV